MPTSLEEKNYFHIPRATITAQQVLADIKFQECEGALKAVKLFSLIIKLLDPLNWLHLERIK